MGFPVLTDFVFRRREVRKPLITVVSWIVFAKPKLEKARYESR